LENNVDVQFLFDNDVHKRIVVSVVVFFCTTVASFLVGGWWTRRRHQKEWSTKHFSDRIIVSLNNFADGYLKIRTIFERSLDEVFINSVAIQKIQAAARQTTNREPMLPIDKKDRWFLLNFVLNAVAEKFVMGLVRYDAGVPARPVKYLLWLTAEAVGEDRIRKVRAMMIQKELLANLPETMPKLEQPWHADRMVTLRAAAAAYARDPDNFLELEVYV
jgi:hypothetical protein